MAKSTVKSTPKTLDIIKNDPWLKDYEVAIVGRHRHAEDKIAELTQNGKCSLSDFASGYLYFGLHRTATGWVFREWAPHATEIYLIGDFNDWRELPKYKLKRVQLHTNHGHTGTSLLRKFRLSCIEFLCSFQPFRYAGGTETTHRRGT